MAKPSIFSSRYEEEMKKRKRRIIIAIIALIFAAGIIILSIGKIIDYNKMASEIKKINVFQLNKNSGKSSANTNTDNKKSGSSNNKQQTVKQTPVKKTENKSYSVQLADGKSVKVLYDDSNGNRTIKTLENSDSDIDFNISKTAAFIVIYEKSTQSMMLVNANGKISDITYASYKSESSGTVFQKNDILKNNPNYVWCMSPKFIDDNNIVYISQVPWFDNRPDKYLWIYNISGNTYVNTNVTGTNIQVNGLSDKGIEVVIDGNTEYLKGDGTISK